MTNEGSKLNKIGNKLLYFVVSTLVIMAFPVILTIQMGGKLLKKDLLVFKNKEGEGKVRKFIIDKWLGETYTAQNNRVFVYFLFPALGSFLLFVALPFFQGLWFSLTDWNGLNTGRESFIGFENYRTIITDYAFMYSFFRTVIYSVLNIIVINVVAFSMALLVTQKLKGKNIYRAGFFMPNLIGGLVLGYIWQFIFNKAFVEFGGALDPSILINGDTALIGLIVVVTWQYAGYIMMIYIAAIQNIPQDLVEASKIDGANMFQRLKAITLPLVAQAFTVALFLTLVTSFKQFDTVTSLTQGGPATQLPAWIGSIYDKDLLPVVQSTNLIALNIYSEAFDNYEMGIGQAKAIVFFVVLLTFSLIQVYYNKRREVEM
ncbi:MAG: sn-glycerol-3-phosphate transport system permease protein UgpA [Candidatus Izimaplasma bacterium HR2]|nr:MAG: sn-glycerol-3-phosphate transport system permease protein UgpA [Candidatus Izimaplasma bacterium HR2]